MAALRRSGRARKANTKYAEDLLEEETRRALAPISGSPSESEHDPVLTDGDISGSDFNAEKAAEDHGDGGTDDEDELSNASGGARPMSQGSDIKTPVESEDDLLSVASDYDSEGRPTKARRIALRRPTEDKKTHFRGLGAQTSGAKDSGWNTLFGSSQHDYLPAVYARDIWLNSDDITLPSRKSLGKAVADGEFGKTNRCGVTEEKLRHEAMNGWDWYYGDKGAHFRRRQRASRIDDVAGQRKYHPTPQQTHHGVVLGPSPQQSKITVTARDSIDLGETWQLRPISADSDAMELDSPPKPAQGKIHGKNRSKASSKETERDRDGWLLNIGQRIQCLSWAPNMRGTTQYLAVSCSTTSSQRRGFAAHVSAMRGSPPYPSNIQIWSIGARQELGKPSSLDMSAKPRLQQVLCTDWGEIRQLTWCPVLRQDRDLASDQLRSEHIGILGLVCSDGSVRVLDVSIQKESKQYVHLDSPAFTASPPTSAPIYTSMAFLSPTDLAVSDSTGSVHLFSMTAGVPQTVDHVARPYYTTPIAPASTYILRMSPCYPSNFPGLLAFSSAGGETSLISLAQPHVDVVSAGRYRLSAGHISYMPQICGHCVSQDDGLYFHPVRRFFSATTLGRATSSGNITCHDTSRWHPFVIAGTSGGEVFASNALRRVLPLGKLFGAGGHWQQRILKYDWIPDQANISSTQADGAGQVSYFHGRDVRPGVSRFHEGFRPERPDLSKSISRMTATAKKKGANTETSGIETIFEEENAVTTIQWNPNLACAGWVAIGFGSGLIRVDDFAWE